jgi:cytoskeletal protein CcmA (bactofilin family)
VIKKGETLSIIDQGAEFEGTLSCKGKILINGTVKGILNGEVITIGEKGIVHAETKAEILTIGGKFEGKIEASEKLTVRSTGYCEGEVICRDLVVEPGGILNGRVVRRLDHLKSVGKKE